MKNKLLYTILIFSIQVCFAQSSFETIIGGLHDEKGWVVKEYTDSGYICCAHKDTIINNINTGCFWLIKLDNHGDTVWSNIYDTIQQYPRELFILKNEYIVVLNGSIMSVRFNGKINWVSLFGTINPINDESYVITDAVHDSSNTIVCGQYFKNLGTNIVNDPFISKVDQNGNILWRKVYQTTKTGWATSILKSGTGYATSGFDDHSPTSFAKPCVTLFNHNGGLIKTKKYEIGQVHGRSNDIVKESDSVYVLIGNNSSQPFTYKISSSLDSLFFKEYPNLDIYGFVKGYSRLSDIIIGCSGKNTHLVSIDNSGTINWKRKLKGNIMYVEQTTHNGIVCTGEAFDDAYVVKLDSLGRYVSLTEILSNPKIVYPNPFSDKIIIDSNVWSPIDYRLVNINGLVRLTGSTNYPHVINTETTEPGMYFLSFTIEGQHFSLLIIKP